MTTIAFGADHAGYELKEHLAARLRDRGFDIIDHGTDSTASVDYPPFCAAAARSVRDGDAEFAIVVGGSGQGEQLAANKVRGVRAALAWNVATATLARQHNDANVVAIGARQHPVDDAVAIVDAFLAEPFSGEARHQRRIDQLAAYEARR